MAVPQPAPIALQQTADPAWLLSAWRGQGWRILQSQVITPVPVDAAGRYLVQTQIDAFEWVDASFAGLGNAGQALSQIRQYVRSGGSDLYAYAIFTRTDLDFLGLKVTRYRLVLLHSLVQFAAVALAILAVAFVTLIFIQYITTGRSALLSDLVGLWGQTVKSTVTAPIQQVTNSFIWVAVAGGVAVIAFSAAAKASGGRAPRASLGVRAGPVTASAGT